jgi:hypothetical protein
MMNKKATAVIVIIVIASGATLFLGYLWGNDFQLSDKPKEITPTIDGVIEDREWRRATHYNIPFYLDVDNTLDTEEGKRNVDGWNYISVGEDATNYYIALDLCSDRTNNLEDEWIAFFLSNRMPDIFYSRLALNSLQDYGLEYLFYNVSGNKPYNYSFDDGFFPTSSYDIPILPENDIVDVILGNTTSSIYDFWNGNDGKTYSITSYQTDPGANWIEGHYASILFGINVTKKFPEMETAQFLSDLSDMDLYYFMTANITANPLDHADYAERFYCTIAEHGPSAPPFDSPGYLLDYNHINFQNDTFTSGSVDLDHSNINGTDGMFYFTLHCYNELNNTDSAFYEVFIDRLSLKLTTTSIQTLIDNTITEGNYNLKWTYGSSDNCANNHRMFEFSIAKSEFPEMPDDKLYVMVGGYGTMSLVGTNYWAYPGDNNNNPLVNFPEHMSDFVCLDMSST